MWKKMSAKKCWKVYWVVIGVYWALSRTGQDSGVEDLSTTLARPGCHTVLRIDRTKLGPHYQQCTIELIVHTCTISCIDFWGTIYSSVKVLHETTSQLSIVHGKFQSGGCQDLDRPPFSQRGLGHEPDSSLRLRDNPLENVANYHLPPSCD